MMSPVAHHLLEHFPEAGRHQIVKDGVNGRADVEEHPRDDVHVLEDFMVAVGPVADEAPHQAVRVKRGPADCENHN